MESSAAVAQPLPPQAVIMQMVMGAWVTKVISEATRLIDASLDDIETDATARGYTFRDTADVRRQLQWLFQRIRHHAWDDDRQSWYD